MEYFLFLLGLAISWVSSFKGWVVLLLCFVIVLANRHFFVIDTNEILLTWSTKIMGDIVRPVSFDQSLSRLVCPELHLRGIGWAEVGRFSSTCPRPPDISLVSFSIVRCHENKCHGLKSFVTSEQWKVWLSRLDPWSVRGLDPFVSRLTPTWATQIRLLFPFASGWPLRPRGTRIAVVVDTTAVVVVVLNGRDPAGRSRQYTKSSWLFRVFLFVL